MFNEKKAVIFVRKSLEEKNESCGLEYQAKMCLNKAKEQGYEVVEVIEEENSAYNKSISERPKLQAMLDMATEKKVNAVICWQQSRLARDMSDIIIISGVLSEAECDIIFSDPNEPNFEQEGIGKLYQIIKSWSNEEEVKQLRIRVKEHLRERARDGRYVGGTYTGYQWDTMRKRMVEVPEEMEVVKLIFQHYLYEGKSVNRIAKVLNKKGYRTKNGKKFYPYSIVSILQTKIYCGYYRWGFTTSVRRGKPEEAEGFDAKVDWIEPIITLEEWNKVQEIMISRSGIKRGQKCRTFTISSFLLSGKVYCGFCEKKMSAQNGSTKYVDKSGSKKVKEYYKYRCCNSELKHPYKKVFDSKQIDLLVFEQLSSEIRQLNKDKLFNKMQEEVKLVTKSLVEEKQSVKGKIDKVYLAIEKLLQHIERTSDYEMVSIYEGRIREHRLEMKTLQVKLEKIEGKVSELTVNEKDIHDLIEMLNRIHVLKECSQEEKRLYVDQLVERVTLEGDKCKITIKYLLRDKNNSNVVAPINFISNTVI